MINICGALAMLYFMVDIMMRDERVATAVLASTGAGLATGLGALALPFLRQFNPPRMGRMMAFAAGVMMAAAIGSLLWPSFAAARLPVALDAWLGMALGAGAIHLLDRAFPHLHAAPQSQEMALPVNALWLMVVAIAVHNLPEGFAVGAGFSGDTQLGWMTALSIGLQNIPEGLIVACALWSLRLPRAVAMAGALLTGLVEPLGAFLGGAATGLSDYALAPALGFAAGGMVFITVHELIPESIRLLGKRHQALAIFASSMAAYGLLLLGFN